MKPIHEFQTPQVADLYWLLCSPNLIPLENGEYIQRLGLESLELLKHWDKTQALHFDDTHYPRLKRLGFYAEALLHHFFSQHPNIHLLAFNHQVIVDRQTKGELDFVFRDLRTSQLIHLEFACKFYIQENDNGTLDDFVGFNRKDTLEKKARRLINKQLCPAPSDFEGISGTNHEFPLSIGAMKGRLFYENQDHFVEGLTENHLRGQLHKPEKEMPDGFELCHKHAWLSGHSPHRTQITEIPTKGHLYFHPKEDKWLAVDYRSEVQSS